MSGSEKKARSIADAALKLGDEKREGFIATSCGNDEALLTSVRAMLAEEAADIADAPTMAPVPKTAAFADPSPPSKIAHFTIRRVIGSGGMGTVYEGVQDNPRRKVAVKVMRSGVTSRAAQRRFSFESQVLARLHHQGIAQIYEAGTWDDGSGGVPWFAMEYIVGSKSLSQYAHDKKLGTRDRLRLFAKVCDAVSHGHQKGIIHRDLKPGNILVDANGQPKVIDFGVARATDSDMAVTTLQTDVGQLLGTVQYMSPEQCEADPDLLDTRSDVYSLGVILYELLCEALPYDLSSVPVFEAARVIREDAPGRPSTIDRTLRGDVETMVMKALQKDRDQRYQSAHELQGDIERYLNNEPIQARPPSITYQLKIFAKRNRAIFVSIASIAAVLVLATIVSIGLAISAKQSAAAAEEARQEATANAERAETLRDEAVESFNMLVMTSELTEDLFALGAPRNAQGRSMSVHDIALQATDEITKRFSDIPHLEAPSRRAIGTLLWEMGDLDNAEVQLDRAVDVFNSLIPHKRAKEHVQTALALSRVLVDKGDYETAGENAQAILDLPYAEVMDEEDRLGAQDVLADIASLMGERDALRQRREIVGAIESGAKVPLAFHLGAQVDLAESLIIENAIIGDDKRFEVDHLGEATALLESVSREAEAELGHMHPVTIQARGLICSMDLQESLQTLNFEGIKAKFQQQFDDCRLVFGSRHTKTAQAATGLGMTLMAAHQDAESAKNATELLSEAVEIFNTAGGSGFDLANAEQYLGIAYMRTGRTEEAELLLRKSVTTYAQLYGEDASHVITLKAALSIALLSKGNFEEGEPIWQEVYEFLSAGEAGSSAAAGAFRMRMARAYIYMEYQQEGLDTVIEELIQDMAESNGAADPVTLSTATGLCVGYHNLGLGVNAMDILESLLEKTRLEVSAPNPQYLLAELSLAGGHWDLGKFDKAEELADRLEPEMVKIMGPWHREVITLQTLQTKILESQGRVDEAIAHAEALHGSLVGGLGEEDPSTLRAEGALNSLYVDTGQWDAVDSIMAARRARWHNNPDELLKLASMIRTNDNGEYAERYLNLALDSAQRAVAIRGEASPEVTHALAEVHRDRGEHAEAVRWIETTIANAGEDHEDIEIYRSMREAIPQQDDPAVEGEEAP
ncbi:MAG: serine/threonine-protein kinase [Phycisphaerales bacterium]|nr:serine/threonine-protein kinase [Phycisphaerales bacterium]